MSLPHGREISANQVELNTRSFLMELAANLRREHRTNIGRKKMNYWTGETRSPCYRGRQRVGTARLCLTIARCP